MKKYIGIYDNFEKVNIIHEINEKVNGVFVCKCGHEVKERDFFATVTTEEQVIKMKRKPDVWNVEYCICAK